jgi:cytochrome c-type biogenesis protein CcmF
MELGTILLYLAFALGFGSVILSFLYLRTEDETERRYARYLLFACFIATTGAFFLILYYFLVSDLHVMYVHSYTNRSYAWYYKLTGAWAGQKGSILLWTWLISLSLTIQEAVSWRRLKKANGAKAGSGIYDWIRPMALVILIVFIGLLIRIEMFATTDPFLQSLFPDGRGLNPLLLTPLMIVHPPLEFLAYAFITIPFAAAMAFLVTGDRKWVDVSLQWGRLAWLFFTLAIGVGALWAYTVLSFSAVFPEEETVRLHGAPAGNPHLRADHIRHLRDQERLRSIAPACVHRPHRGGC